jgi:hypothetical protein
MPGDYEAFAIARNTYGYYGNWAGGNFEVDQEAVNVSASPDHISEQEQSSSTVTFTRVGPTDFDLTVQYLTGGDAQWGSNFNMSPSGSVTIPAGSSSATATVTAVDNHYGSEGDRTIEIDVYDQGYQGDYIPGPNGTTDITIDDNLESFTLSAGAASIDKGGSVDFTVTRNGDSVGEANVPFYVYAPNFSSSDYQVTSPTTGTVHFDDGQTTGTITIATYYPGSISYGELDVWLQSTDEGYLGSPDSASVEVDDPNALRLAMPPIESGAHAIDGRQVAGLLPAAAAQWLAAGEDPSLVAKALASVKLHVADLPGNLIGQVVGDDLWIDTNAAGYGWFVDATPGNHSEFPVEIAPTQWQANGLGPAAGHADLLTAITHELGHLLGFADVNPADAPHEIMDAEIDLGTRRYAASESDVPFAAASGQQRARDLVFAGLGGFDSNLRSQGVPSAPIAQISFSPRAVDTRFAQNT